MKTIEIIILSSILLYTVSFLYSFLTTKDKDKQLDKIVVFSIGYLITLGLFIGIAPLFS
jgi:hypothetical protein